jgi:hypothetical protein
VFAARISAPQTAVPPAALPEDASEKANGHFFGHLNEVSGGHFSQVEDGHLSQNETEVIYDEDDYDDELDAPARHSPNLGHTEAHVPSDDYDDVERDVE